MRENFLVFGAPRIEQVEIDEVVSSLNSGWLGTGPKVAQFEQDFCAYKNGWGYPVAVNSCTAALHLSMLGAGLKPGDEVITSALTFCATVNAIIHAGCKPVLADVEPASMNICPESIQQQISPKTKAIIPVHFAGRPCDMHAIGEIAERHNLKIIEDCAHAIETQYEGKPAGTFGDFSCFSFYVTKNVATGEGGMVLARNEEDANRLKTLALHGMSKDAWKRFSDDGYKHYDVVACGFKYNMMDIQAALGIHQLARVKENWNRRRQIWDQYFQMLDGIDAIQLPTPADKKTRHGLHLFPLLLKEDSTISRDQLLMGLHQQKIGSGVHYRCIAEHSYYQQQFGWKVNDYPVSTSVGRRTLSIPFSSKLADEDVLDVVQAIKKVLG